MTTSTTSMHRGVTRSGLVALVVGVVMLAGVALPLVRLKHNRERQQATEQEMDVLVSACRSYFRDTHELPQRLRDLVVRPTGHGVGWAGPYVDPHASRPGATPDCLMDAWQQPYQIIPGSDSHMTIYSAGADQDDLEDDILRWIDVKPQRTAETIERLGVLNAAIDRYLLVHPDRSFRDGVAALLAALRAEQFVSEDAAFGRDGWGELWVADPPDQAPIQRLTSRHLLPTVTSDG